MINIQLLSIWRSRKLTDWEIKKKPTYTYLKKAIYTNSSWKSSWMFCRGLSEPPTKGNKGCLVVGKHTFIFYQRRHQRQWSINKSCDRHAFCTRRCMVGTIDVLSGKLIHSIQAIERKYGENSFYSHFKFSFLWSFSFLVYIFKNRTIFYLDMVLL